MRSRTTDSVIMLPRGAIAGDVNIRLDISLPAPHDSPNAATVVILAALEKIFQWKCCICLEEQLSSEPRHTGLCGSNACSESFCRTCLEAYFSDAASSSRFTVLPIRCPAAACRRRVPTERWIKLAPAEAVEVYHKGARDSLNFRCPSCDDSGSLIVECFLEPQLRAAAVEDYLAQNMRASFRAERLLKRRWAAFSTGAATADQVLDALLAVLGCGSILDLTAKQLRGALCLIPDVERRCALHLACLRRSPLIWTPCCGIEICWRCQVSGHHHGMSCEEFQREQLAVECQFCPGCGVATQRTEGCSHIVCLCGENWEWQDEAAQVLADAAVFNADDWTAPLGEGEGW